MAESGITQMIGPVVVLLGALAVSSIALAPLPGNALPPSGQPCALGPAPDGEILYEEKTITPIRSASRT